MRPADFALLRCPSCRGTLRPPASVRRDLRRGALTCTRCARAWPVRDGLPRLVDDAEVRGVDRLMRAIYDAGARLHDPGVRFLLPLLQGSGAGALRDGYMPRLELGALRAVRGRPPRILEVGVGTGANLPLVERDLPADLDVELWGCDLSEGMLARCRRRLATHRGRQLRLLVADAHALPFPDHSFDRVFHVGGIAGYRDPARGLAEMARVARPGTPIVVVDEQLDPDRRHGLYHRLMFRALTFYTPEAVAPRADLPASATDVVEEQVSRFYYCLRFRMPPPRPRRAPRRITPPAGGRCRRRCGGPC
jgi:ubiquinone/menaquinone biosynthesis C-methylase UbiE/uncharacterized protein YbaR (Trm112 family)